MSESYKYIPVHSCNETFALGVFDTLKEAEEAYVLYIKSHDGYSELSERYKNKMGKDLDSNLNSIWDLGTEELEEFWEDEMIGCMFFHLKTYDRDWGFFTQMSGWLPEMNGQNHISMIMRALETDSYLHRDFELDIEKFAQDHPMY